MSSTFENTISVLAKAGIPSPRLEARILIAEASGQEAGNIGTDSVLDKNQQEKLEEMLSLRLQNMPLDKIIGSKDFYKYSFNVTCDVLSPRPDTEVLVEEALRLSSAFQSPSFLDLGTGSGCILLSLLGERKDARGVGVDCSEKALAVAASNAEKIGVKEQVRFCRASWFDEDFGSLFAKPFDLIVSNPPYIPTGDISGLEENVRKYDPFGALDGGEDGLDHYRQLAKVIPPLLKETGYVLLEIGISQAEDVCKVFEKAGLKTEKVLRDLSGIERCIILKK